MQLLIEVHDPEEQQINIGFVCAHCHAPQIFMVKANSDPAPNGKGNLLTNPEPIRVTNVPNILIPAARLQTWPDFKGEDKRLIVTCGACLSYETQVFFQLKGNSTFVPLSKPKRTAKIGVED